MTIFESFWNEVAVPLGEMVEECVMEISTSSEDKKYKESNLLFMKTMDDYQKKADELKELYESTQVQADKLNVWIGKLRREEEVIKQICSEDESETILGVQDYQYLLKIMEIIKKPEIIKDKIVFDPQIVEKGKWDTSSLNWEDLEICLFFGPLGVLVKRLPESYSISDVEKVQEARGKLIEEIRKLDKKNIELSLLKSELENRIKICIRVLQLIENYKNSK